MHYLLCKRKNISIYTIIFFNAIFFSHCDTLSNITVSYSVKLDIQKPNIVEIEMTVDGDIGKTLFLHSYSPQSVIENDILVAMDDEAKELPVIEDTTKIEALSEIDNRNVRGVIQTKGSKKIKIRYKIKIGSEINAHHGIQSFRIYDYMNKEFALLSGKSIFLVPGKKISRIKVKVDLPLGWRVSIPWKLNGDEYLLEQNPYLKETLVNTCIAVGKLEKREKVIGQTTVRVYLYEEWHSDYKDELYQKAFQAYSKTAEIFGSKEGGTYHFNFVPESDGKRKIFSTHWSSSQGMAFFPSTPERWRECIEKLTDRWVKFPPYHMVFSLKEDFWLVDGLRRYCAIEVGHDLGVLDREHYWSSESIRFVKGVIKYKAMEETEVTWALPILRNVEQLYDDNSPQLRLRRDQVAPTVVRFVNEYIKRRNKQGKTIEDVLKHEYRQKQGLSFLRDIDRTFDKPLSKELRPLLYDLPQLAKNLKLIDPIGSLPSRSLVNSEPSNLDTARILLSGNIRGFIEQCGCKSNQQGGLARRATNIKSLRQKFSDLIVVDVGNLFPKDPQNQFWITDFESKELDIFLQATEQMDYDLTAVSFNELFYGYDFFASKKMLVNFPFLCANVFKNGSPIGTPIATLTSGNLKLGFIGLFQYPTEIISKNIYQFQNRTADLTFRDPLEVLQEYLPQLTKNHDIVIVVGRLEPKFIRDNLAQLDRVDVIISSYKFDSRLRKNDRGLLRTEFATSGFWGDLVVFFERISLYGADQLEVIYDKKIKQVINWKRKLVRLGDDIQDDPGIRAILDTYYDSGKFEFENIKPIVEWDEFGETQGFVGVEKCQSCHVEQFLQWKSTSHAFAFNTLLDAHRHNHPKCVVCHVTGAGYPSGFKLGEVREKLINVQCEMCHGPGKLHALSPSQFRMIRSPKENLCVSCHDSEHSDFNMETYYPFVVH